MLKRMFFTMFTVACCHTGLLMAHCQMPCGIYHDDMVFDQVDQYVETMFKAISVLEDNAFANAKDRNEFMRWVYQKDRQSDAISEIILTYFLQQKIKPGESDTVKKLVSAHKLLFLAVAIKQHVDTSFVEDFNKEWENFKLMFHIEGYECKVEQLKLKKRAELEKQKGINGQAPNESHDHDHEEGHTH